jgi:hypothetical protein
MIVISTEILLPFLPALAWATMVITMVILSTWPLLLHAQARLGGRRTTAVAVMTIGLLLLLIGPVLFAVLVIINHAGEIVSGGRSLSDVTIPPPPEWLERLPIAGAKIAAAWQNFRTTGLEDLSVHVTSNVEEFLRWLVGQVGNLTMVFVQLLRTITLCAVLYSKGEVAAGGYPRLRPAS